MPPLLATGAVLVGEIVVVLPEFLVLLEPRLVVLPLTVLPEAVLLPPLFAAGLLAPAVPAVLVLVLVLPTPVLLVELLALLSLLAPAPPPEPVPPVVVGEIVGEIVELAFALTPEPVAWPPVKPVPPVVPWLEELLPLPCAALPVLLLVFVCELAANALWLTAPPALRARTAQLANRSFLIPSFLLFSPPLRRTPRHARMLRCEADGGGDHRRSLVPRSISCRPLRISNRRAT